MQKLRALIVPHGFRRGYFESFLKHVRQADMWNLSVLCDIGARRTYRSFVSADNDLVFQPDFSRPFPDEDDPGTQQRIEALIHACEARTGIPANRILLAAERDIGRAYSKALYYWTDNALARRSLRRPETGQAVLWRLFRFCDQLLDDTRPEFILCGVTSSPLLFVLSLVSEHRNIPMIVNRWSKVVFGKCFWTDDRTMLNGDAIAAYRRLSAGQTPVSPEAKAFIDRWREKPQMNTFVAGNWSAMNIAHGWWQWHKTCAQLALSKAIYIVKGRNTTPPKEVLPKVLEYYASAWYRSRTKQYVRRYSAEELAQMTYLYLPLHKEPEQALNFQSFPFHDQSHLIRVLSANLPRGTQLLVREHRGTWGRRRPGYLKALNQLPNVSVIDPYDDQFKYIRNAAAVVTDNGSAGFEGLLGRRRVISLSPNFYNPTGLTTEIRDILELPGSLVRAVHGNPEGTIPDEEWDRRMGWLYDAENETTISNDGEAHEKSVALILKIAARHSGSPDLAWHWDSDTDAATH
jgi:hypothetical protein